MRYKPYPKYKESGVAWLGEVPEHWEIWKISHAFNTIGSGTTPTSTNESYYNGHIPWVTTGELREKIILDTKKKLTKKALLELSSLKLFPKGSILIAMYGATIGRLGKLGIEATTNQACCVITSSSQILNDYLYYWLLGYRKEIINLGYGGGQPNISQDTISNLKISAPNIEEQENIILYLDQKTQKIDTLIEKQQTLIKLLKEKRQALISHAVTKGLDDTVKMKDSGVAWLGEVPEHWTLPKISFIGNVTNGTTPDKSNKSYWTNGTIPWLASGCLNTDRIIEPTALISKEAYIKSSVKLIPSGSLLVGMVGQGKTRGTSALLEIDSCINQNLASIIPSDKININFLHFLFQAMYLTLRESGRGSNQSALNCDIIKAIKIPYPPLKEQKKIAQYLDQKTNQIDTLISKSTQAIELLKERRSALISAVVTGKVDVRGEVC